MLFNSPIFIFGFFPLTLAFFYLTSALGGPRAAQVWLIFASLAFYGYWNPIYLPLIITSMVANFGMGLLLSKTNREGKPRLANLYLGLGVGANLMLLGYFKYANFFVNTSNDLFSTGWTLEKIILPLGISFFTFQKIGYLVDARQGHRLDHTFLQYCLFVVFFPQLLAGPIVHHSQVIPQFGNRDVYKPNLENIAVGLTIFIIGLAKKVILADTFATVASPVFAAAEGGHSLHMFQAWQGVFAYTFQIYFDFSGYTDMAIGLARCFGIKLPLNFHSPYQAANIIDFWRRWHMTLSRFLRDYLYIAMGGNRHGPVRRYANLMTTMLLGGLWHGAGWNFVIWGGLHGGYLVINHAWQKIFPWATGSAWYRWLARLITFLAVAFAWVFFRAPTLAGASAIFKGMMNLPESFATKLGPLAGILANMGFRFTGPYFSDGDLESLGWLILLMAFVWFLPNTQQIMARAHPAFNFSGDPKRDAMPAASLSPVLTRKLSWNMSLTWALGIGILCFAGLSSLNRVSEFIYFQF
jgi:alginate O-acetyltransferase complex protein AlgI